MLLVALLGLVFIPLSSATLNPMNSIGTKLSERGSSSGFGFSETMASASVSQSSLQILTNATVECKGKDHSGEPNGDSKGRCLKACDSTSITYYTIANAGSTYQWFVTGAISFTATANQVVVNWGAVGSGNVKLIETKADNTKDSVEQCIEIIPSPTANFSTLPTIVGGTINVCLQQPINFTDLSLGATSWFWDFGDGNTFIGQYPPAHSYSLSGSYVVTLIVKNDCNCSDTLKVNVEVDALPGPEIECPSVVCEGDTAVYTTSANCTNYIWTVTGGTIISSPLNSNSIVVVWGNGSSGPGTVTLDVSGCPGFCTVPTTITIPIIPQSATINGPIVVCQYSTTNYQVPNIPATTYNWTVNPGGIIISGQGTNMISVYWNTPGTHVIKVDYINKLLDCGGTGKLIVNVLPPFFIGGPISLCPNVPNTSNPFNANSYSGPVPVNWSVITPGGSTLSNLQTGSSSFNTYNWSAGPGTYTVMAVASPGTFCNDTVTTTVTVLDTIPRPTITGAASICPGGTYQYSAGTTLSNVTFTWSVTGGTIIPSSGIGSPVTVTWNPIGPYSISVSQALNASPFCSSLPAVLNVNPLVSPVISGPLTTCVNGVTTYTATSIPGYTYNWTLTPSGLGSIVSGNGTNSVQIQWLNNPGTATLSISYPQCNSLSSTLTNIIVTNAPVPSITPSGPLCSNGPGINLTSSPAASYTWTNGSNVAFGGNNQTVGITVGGHYNLAVVYANGCMSSNSINIAEEPSPIASISSPAVLTYCNAPIPNITLYALTGAGYTFQWWMNSSPLSGQTNSSFTTNLAGSYFVVVTLGNCSSTSNVLVITQVPTCDTGCVTNKNVNFTYTKPACNPVTFNGNISSGIGSYFWNFGDPLSGPNNYSNSLNPTHNFTNAGFYNVVFTGTGISTTPPDSCQTFKLKTVKIPLVAKFKIRNQCLSDTIFFDDLSTFTPGDNITSWLWNFGDPGSGVNNTSTLASPYHIFSTPGPHTITLTVTNPLCTETYSINYNILDATPTISLFPSPTCVNTPINFSGASTSTILSWLWNFGDTTSSVLQNVIKTFAYPGIHTITLSVIDAQGCKGSATSTVNILNPPVPDTITALTPTTICDGDSVMLQAPAGTSYLWSNGSTTQTIAVYQGGNYYVEVTDANGCKYTTTSVVVTVVPSPSVSVTGNTNLCAGDYLFLTATYGASFTYQWYYNNSPVSGSIYSYFQKFGLTVSDAGLYSVVVKDTLTGCSTTVSVNVTVYPTPIVPVIAISPSGPYCSGHVYTIAVTNVDPTLTYTWSNGSQGTSITTSVQGNYSVQASNQFGCKVTSNSIFIALSPDISDVISGCYEFCDTLMPRVIPAPPGYASYQWLQLDTATNTFTTVGTNQYLSVSTSGIYYVVLTNSFGCVDTSDHIEITFVHCTDCEKLNVEFTPVESDSTQDCCWNISISNLYSDSLLSALQINTLNGVGLQFSNLDTAWSVQNFNNTSVTLVPHSGSIPLGSYNHLIQLCLNGIDDSTQQVVFNWIGQGPEYPVVCRDTIQLHCDRDFTCVGIVKDSIYCEGDTLHYSFYIKNFGTHNIQSMELHLDTLSNVTVTPSFVVVPAIVPGGVYGPINVTLTGSGLIPGQLICFTLSAQDSTTDENSDFCCTDGIEHCIVIPPLCNPCDSLDVTVVGNGLDCCWELQLHNHAYLNIVGVQTEVISGSGFIGIDNPLGSGWNMNMAGFNNIFWTASNGQPLSTETTLPKICLDGLTPGPHVVVVNWLVQGITQDTVLCSDTLVLNCLSDCIGLVGDSITCNDDGTYQYSFIAYNNYNSPIEEFEFVGYSPSSAFVNPPVFTGTIPVAGIGVYTTTISGNPGDEICFRVKAYDYIEHGEHHNCCTTDSVYCITLPSCDPTLVRTETNSLTKGYLSVYPNPLKGNASISFAVPNSGEVQFKIYSLNGGLISIPYKARVEGKKNYSFNLNVSTLKKGVYIGLLRTNSGYAVYKKLIISE